jgi:hypothetical protein
MKLTFVYKGGPGSGFTSEAGHRGRPGLVGGSGGYGVKYTYSNIPASQRSNSTYYAGGGSYKTNVDSALIEPVRILNEVMGYNTFASCEGHAKDWNHADTLGYTKDKDGNPTGFAFQESYVAIWANENEMNSMESYLKTQGFEIGSTPRSNVIENSYDLFKNVNGYHLIFDITKPIAPGGKSEFVLRIGSGILNPSKAKTHKLSTGETFKNIGDSLQGQKALSQKDWDTTRDAGWDKWLGIMQNYKGAK